MVPTPVLPVSGSDPSPSAARLLLTRLTSSTAPLLSARRPWSELLDRSAFSRPDTLSDAASRLRKNIRYFRVNYLLLIALSLTLSLLTNPFSLVSLLILLAAWCFLYLLRPTDQPLTLFNRTYSDKETIAGLVLLTVVVLFMTSVGAVIMSAVVAGGVIVGAHGALRVPEDLFLDEQEAAGPGAGLLSLFTGGVAVPAGPPVIPVRT